MRQGEECLVAVYVDKSSRLAATMKVYSHMSSESPYQKDDKVTGTVYEINENLGAFVAVDNKYYGLIPKRELFGDIHEGDVVEARVMKTKKSYGFARLIQVLEPSACRVTPRCPSARQCGGCQLQAMSYEEQLRFKENKVRNNLSRIGGLTEIPMEPIIGMEEPWRYRNKAQFPFGKDKNGRIITGFYAGRTHAIIEQEDCLLGVEENQPILDCIRGFMEEYHIAPYEEELHKGLIRHVLIRKGFTTGELMVCLVLNGDVKKLKAPKVLVERLVKLFPSHIDRKSVV